MLEQQIYMKHVSLANSLRTKYQSHLELAYGLHKDQNDFLFGFVGQTIITSTSDGYKFEDEAPLWFDREVFKQVLEDEQSCSDAIDFFKQLFEKIDEEEPAQPQPTKNEDPMQKLTCMFDRLRSDMNSNTQNLMDNLSSIFSEKEEKKPEPEPTFKFSKMDELKIRAVIGGIALCQKVAETKDTVKENVKGATPLFKEAFKTLFKK